MGVDIAAAQHGRDLLALVSAGIVEDCREPSGPRPFNDGLFDADQHRHCLLDRALGDEDEIIGQVLENLPGEHAGLLDRNALGQRVAAEREPAALDRAFHRRVELGLGPDQRRCRA